MPEQCAFGLPVWFCSKARLLLALGAGLGLFAGLLYIIVSDDGAGVALYTGMLWGPVFSGFCMPFKGPSPIKFRESWPFQTPHLTPRIQTKKPVLYAAPMRVRNHGAGHIILCLCPCVGAACL